MGFGAWRFAATYDLFISGTERAGLAEHRAALLAPIAGQVLEIGGGTGANLALYGPEVETLTITEPDRHMFVRLQRKVKELGRSVTLLRAPAEDLPFDADSFDVVVSTVVLCSVDDQPRALREIRRVLRPGGQLVFIEHVRSDDPTLAGKQDRMNWLNRIVVRCDCNRATVPGIQAAGFTVTRLEHAVLPKAPSFASPLVIGAASA